MDNRTAPHIDLLRFSHGGVTLAVPLAGVREVLQMLKVTPVPEAPEGIWGVVNIRGEVIPVLELEARLRGLGTPPTIDHHILVLDLPDLTLAVIVQRVQEVTTVESNRLHPTEDVLGKDSPITSVVHDDEQLIPVLEVSQLLSQTEIRSIHDILEELATANREL